MAEDRSRDDSNRLVMVAVAALIGLIGVSVFLEPKNIAVQNDRSADEASQELNDSKDDSKNQPEEKSVPDDDYTYTAKDGDSYTVLARQAVAAMAGSNLSAAQRIAAETKLTQDAGAPDLAVGQLVVLDKSTVQAAIDWADSLAPDDEAAWQVYVDNVVLPEIK